jgi:predicted  nucleic acid-binding Zn-ribbon protein
LESQKTIAPCGEISVQLESLHLRTALIGGFDKISVYQALQALDAHYSEISRQCREQASASTDEERRALAEENEKLRERCSALMQAQSRLLADYEPLEKRAESLSTDVEFLRCLLEKERANAAEVAGALEELRAKLLQPLEESQT